jgi:hypothetical protein
LQPQRAVQGGFPAFDAAEPGASPRTTKGGVQMGILWIILIVVLILALLGFFSRGAW